MHDCSLHLRKKWWLIFGGSGTLNLSVLALADAGAGAGSVGASGAEADRRAALRGCARDTAVFLTGAVCCAPDGDC